MNRLKIVMKWPGREMFLDGEPLKTVIHPVDSSQDHAWFLQTSEPEVEVIPPRTAKIVPVYKPHLNDGTIALIEPQHLDDKERTVLVARMAATVADGGAYVQVVNLTNEPYHLEGGDLLATVKPIEESQIKGELYSPLPARPYRLTPSNRERIYQELICNLHKRKQLGDTLESTHGVSFDDSDLTEEEKQLYTVALDAMKHVFATSEADIGSIPLTEHTIDTGDAVPIRQATYRT